MANNIITIPFLGGGTLSARLWNRTAEIWNGSTFVAYATADVATYDFATTQLGTASRVYSITVPATLAAGRYRLEVVLGDNSAEGQPFVWSEWFGWNGTDLIEESNVLQAMNKQVMGTGTVTTGATTTSVPTSACNPAGAVANQFMGAAMIFSAATTTAALRGVRCRITASSNAATPTFTVEMDSGAALPATPASGDTFVIA